MTVHILVVRGPVKFAAVSFQALEGLHTLFEKLPPMLMGALGLQQVIQDGLYGTIRSRRGKIGGDQWPQGFADVRRQLILQILQRRAPGV